MGHISQYRSMLVIAAALALAFYAAPGVAHDDQTVIVELVYDKDVAASAAQTQNKPVPTAQDTHEWDGIAPVVDPAEKTGVYDVHEFEVLPNFDNDSMEVKVTWDQGPGVVFDLDLYVERLVDGAWLPFAQSTNSQAATDTAPKAEESIVAFGPVPGTYRTRVHNWASHSVTYHGSASFASDGIITKPKKVKIAEGRAFEDRPDLTDRAQIHTIYFVPSDDGADNALDTDGTLADALLAMDDWFARESGGRRMRLDMYEFKKVRRPDITFVRGLRTRAEYNAEGTFSAVTSELAQRGWTASPALKRYLVYYEGPAQSANICGTASLSLGSGFAQWSVVFLGASPGCGARDFGTPETGPGVSESIAVQEMLHNEGQTRPEAIHHCAANQFHNCTAQAGSRLTAIQRGLDPESVDALFPYVTFALRDKRLDKDNDDYFAHPFPHRDLADSPYWEP